MVLDVAIINKCLIILTCDLHYFIRHSTDSHLNTQIGRVRPKLHLYSNLIITVAYFALLFVDKESDRMNSLSMTT